jgi:hypothetical protein
MVLSIIFWLLIGAATAYFAQQRGRDPLIWLVIGIFLGLLGLLLLFLLPSVKGDQPKDADAQAFRKEPQEPVIQTAPAIQDHSYLVRDWFYLDAEPKQQGPVTFDFLKKIWREGQIGIGTFVWCDGMEKWKKIDELDSLKHGLEEVIEGY